MKQSPGYVPGEQLDGASIIKLNTNENPYPPAPEIADVLQGFDAARLRVYPAPNAAQFRTIASDLHNVPADQVIATNGGDELLRLAIATFVEPGASIGLCTPTYSLYEVLAWLHGASTVDAPLNDDWTLNADTVSIWQNAGARLGFVVNPQAPSGHLIPTSELSAIATAFDGVLVIDEAYVDFVDPSLHYDAVTLCREHDNILLLRTLSKGYSLAGLRFGYGLGSSAVVTPMQTKTKDSYNTDAIAQALACAALGAQDYASDTWARVRRDRDQLAKRLTTLGFACEPSETNFLLVRAPERASAKELYECLRQNNILVRYFDAPRLSDCLRITIGTEAQNDELIRALETLLSG
ncbi:MAG: histidinol-phosphate transaminase [Pseudomonadota bacterium]